MSKYYVFFREWPGFRSVSDFPFDTLNALPDNKLLSELGRVFEAKAESLAKPQEKSKSNLEGKSVNQLVADRTKKRSKQKLYRPSPARPIRIPSPVGIETKAGAERRKQEESDINAWFSINAPVPKEPPRVNRQAHRGTAIAKKAGWLWLGVSIFKPLQASPRRFFWEVEDVTVGKELARHLNHRFRNNITSCLHFGAIANDDTSAQLPTDVGLIVAECVSGAVDLNGDEMLRRIIGTTKQIVSAIHGKNEGGDTGTGPDVPLERSSGEDAALSTLQSSVDTMAESIIKAVKTTVEGVLDGNEKEQATEGLAALPPRVRRAWSFWLAAEATLGQSNTTEPLGITDLAAYEWIRENHDPDEYKLPKFETWPHYVVEARAILDKRKNSPIAGRPTGKSIVSADAI